LAAQPQASDEPQFHPIAPSALPPVVVRLFEPRDLARCTELYHLNAPGRFPDGGITGFGDYLREPEAVKLVVEAGQKIVAVGGISDPKLSCCYVAHLSYGMVDPAWHRRRVGTLLLLARIATLPEPAPWGILKMTNVPSAATFYQRFGFGPYHSVDPDGLHRHAASIDRDSWRATRRIVDDCGVRVEALRALKAGGT
jgi:GNAT superfamily N-acetyltransferase